MFGDQRGSSPAQRGVQGIMIARKYVLRRKKLVKRWCVAHACWDRAIHGREKQVLAKA